MITKHLKMLESEWNMEDKSKSKKYFNAIENALAGQNKAGINNIQENNNNLNQK